MSQIILATIVNLLAVFLPYIGVEVGSEQLTQTIQTLVAVVTGVWIYVRRVNMGGVNLVGGRTETE